MFFELHEDKIYESFGGIFGIPISINGCQVGDFKTHPNFPERNYYAIGPIEGEPTKLPVGATLQEDGDEEDWFWLCFNDESQAYAFAIENKE